jgi:hypothetical protein
MKKHLLDYTTRFIINAFDFQHGKVYKEFGFITKNHIHFSLMKLISLKYSNFGETTVENAIDVYKNFGIKGIQFMKPFLSIDFFQKILRTIFIRNLFDVFLCKWIHKYNICNIDSIDNNRIHRTDIKCLKFALKYNYPNFFCKMFDINNETCSISFKKCLQNSSIDLNESIHILSLKNIIFLSQYFDFDFSLNISYRIVGTLQEFEFAKKNSIHFYWCGNIWEKSFEMQKLFVKETNHQLSFENLQTICKYPEFEKLEMFKYWFNQIPKNKQRKNELKRLKSSCLNIYIYDFITHILDFNLYYPV